MDGIERVQARLEHVHSVQPILGALRTISLASWRSALGRRERIRRYEVALLDVLTALPAGLRASLVEQEPVTNRVLVLVIGSERGLCGHFNAAVVERAEEYREQQLDAGRELELAILGTRTSRMLQRQAWSPAWLGRLSLTTLPSYGLALQLAQRWLTRFRAGELSAVDLVFNDYRGIGQYEPAVRHLLPPHLPVDSQTTQPPWPPPIIDTDPASLLRQVGEQWTAVFLYHTMIDSAVAEHSARYQLMEGATQNTERLTDELTLAVQNARKQAITREMQELAAGAGLVGERNP